MLAAEDGLAGLELAIAEEPDLIICDVMMPKMDGFEVLEGLQAIAKPATIPLIFLTAKVDQDSQRMGMGLGAEDFIPKPFDIQQSLISIQSRLKKRQRYQDKLEHEEQALATVTSQM